MAVKPRKRKTPAERFWAKVEKGSSCWIWKACKNKLGYGNIGGVGSSTLAHRVSFELTHGPIPAGMLVCHNCPGGDNPSCVNPAHLFLGTDMDNAADKMKKGRHASARTTRCKNGHEYTAENTGRKGDGSRKCLICATAFYQLRLARLRESRRAAK